MFAKIFATIFALFGIAAAGVIPAGFVAPYASSYNEHVVNHAIAAPVASAAYVASPYVAAPVAYSAGAYHPAAYSAAALHPAAYSAAAYHPAAYAAAPVLF